MVKLKISFIVLLFVVEATYTAASTSSSSSSSSRSRASVHVTTKKAKKSSESRSTSSSSGARSDDSSGADNSLSMTMSSGSSASDKDRSYMPKSSEERHGWRKWHRKCPRCYEDERKKWKDPSIKWICGAYQRARRSFKSLCSMHYRNCQDGTMFVKIKGRRCQNDTGKEEFPHGDHFFYEYKVKMSDESSDSSTGTSEETTREDSVSY